MAKRKRVVLFKKFFYMAMFLNVFSLFSFFTKDLFFSFNFISFQVLRVGYLYEFFLSFDLFFFSFCLIVSFVCCLVCIFREIYMEHYNSKKFFFLLFFFFLTIIILSFSGNHLFLILGWDGLGVTSLFLIIFYPHKTSLYNSILTSFFNRLGDVILLYFFGFYIFNPCLFFRYLDNDFFLLMVVICAFTKSAQFPLSSWLPAAMSAPTPISAIVHSSTLVTAGIYLIQKLFWSLNLIGLCNFILCVSLIRFFSGGFLANLESDLKKTVAFSTIRQIRIIMVMCSAGRIFISLSHITMHALFKTFLFCTCGLAFLRKFERQFIIKFHLNKSNLYISLFFILRVFIISGLPFSCSYFSKDLFLECWRIKALILNFFVFLSCSLLTIFYCSKIISFFSSSFCIRNSRNRIKSFIFYFLLGFLILSMFSGFLIKFFYSFIICPYIDQIEVLLIFSIFLLPIFKSFSLTGSWQYFSLRIFFSKVWTFSFLSNFKNLEKFDSLFRDQFIFKPTLVKKVFFFERIENFWTKFIYIFILFFSFTFLLIFL